MHVYSYINTRACHTLAQRERETERRAIGEKERENFFLEMSSAYLSLNGRVDVSKIHK